MSITSVNEMYNASNSVHFVSDGRITQPLTLVGQVVTESYVPCFCGIILGWVFLKIFVFNDFPFKCQ